jgi:hypothetical protein
VKLEKDQRLGHFGITFYTTRFTVTPSDRCNLRTLHFPEAKAAGYEVCNRVVELYDKMLTRDLPCVMTVAISKPLTRRQGDLLNDQRMDIARITAAAVTVATKPISGPTSVAAGYGANRFVLNKLPTYHAGDIIIGFDAQVSGGIGPQRSTSSMIIKAYGE